jgi:Icc-related predicted phosphoesterase
MSVRIAAVGDLHYGSASTPMIRDVLAQASDHADVLLVCGDLTDYGRADEAEGLARELRQNVRIPVVAVLGNHDYESNQAPAVRAHLRDAGVVILDGDAYEVQGIGIAGAKGFCGGFGPRTLGAWGEPAVKQFVQEAVNEALKLESALARLRTPQRIVLLHYSPIATTVEGEPLEIYAFLGSSRLEEPIGRFSVTAVFHGHAHRGQPEGRTTSGVPVYNVSLPLMQARNPKQPFVVLTLEDEVADRSTPGV